MPLIRFFLFFTLGLFASKLGANVVISTVPVRDIGNAPDITGMGSVAYAYHIGTHEVTNEAYTAFLNSVAASDPNGLYKFLMGYSDDGGILRSGTEGSYAYVTKPGAALKPVNFVSAKDAARFANWLTNGQPDGAQGPNTTEDGMYDLAGLAVRKRDFAAGEPGVAVASADEWYKAGYYDPTLNGGSGGYWSYSTQSDTAPAAQPPNTTNPNSANYGNVVNTVSEVGAYALTKSYYGTYDQAGNVWEWTESGISFQSYRLRGGGWSFLTSGNEMRGQSYLTSFWNVGFAFGGFRITSNAPISPPVGSDTTSTFSGMVEASGLTGEAALPEAVPFNDGVPNLVKYAFGMDLSGPDNSIMQPGGLSGLPLSQLDASEGSPVWRIEYMRRKNSGLLYTPQASDSLQSESFQPIIGTMTSVTAIDADWERVIIEVPVDSAGTPSCFYRIAVSIE